MTGRAEKRDRSEYSMIFSGRLCRLAGSGRTLTGHPRRAAISLMCAARAPQAMTSMSALLARGGDPYPPSEGELADEPVVEVGSVGEFDIPHLLKEGQGGGAFADREQRHLGALPGDVAGRDDAADRDVRDEAGADRRLRRQVGAEGAGQQHLLDVIFGQAGLFEEDAPAGGDRGLGELELADVTLGEVDVVMQDEDPFLARGGEPAGESRRDAPGR